VRTWKFNHFLALLASFFNLSISTPLNPRMAFAVLVYTEDLVFVLLASSLSSEPPSSSDSSSVNVIAVFSL